MPRKSLVGPTLFTAFGLALLLGLGTWQVQRLGWKERLIAERAAGVAASPVPLPTTQAAAQGLEYHHVRAVGHYVGKPLYLHAISRDGDQGFHVVAPFALADGGAVLIDRGFVPEDVARANPVFASPAAPEIEVTGLLRLAAGKPSWFTPENAPAQGTWFYVDPDAMGKAAGVGPVLPFYIDADREPGARYPIGGQTLLDLPNNHLQYAITWYLLAAALVIVYLRIVLKRGARP
ncbi:MAG TPA: SURF1 family protein [Stellaceae bacterium]|nr:SURF1 family protein [Stellaceae bacterium]